MPLEVAGEISHPSAMTPAEGSPRRPPAKVGRQAATEADGDVARSPHSIEGVGDDYLAVHETTRRCVGPGGVEHLSHAAQGHARGGFGVRKPRRAPSWAHTRRIS